MSLCVIGAGAFGTALAMSFARGGQEVWLWGRGDATMRAMAERRENTRYLPGLTFPETLHPTASLPAAPQVLLLAVPMQQLHRVVSQNLSAVSGRPAVACCKGLSLETGAGPTDALKSFTDHPAILTGPSFAADIAAGLPTALTLACKNKAQGAWLQSVLTAPNLRLYRSDDVMGAELGGALKNVLAIGCGAVMGAGLGVSARAALMTRGFAEITDFACFLGARKETLAGLSGLGDLTLTCTSDLSRNYRYGVALGQGDAFDPSVTVEGATTARALLAHADKHRQDLPICRAIAALLDGQMDVRQAMQALLARPMKEE